MTSRPPDTGPADPLIRQRSYTDPSLRRLKHGPIQPMEQDRRMLWNWFKRP